MRLGRYAHGKIDEPRFSPILTEIPIVILTRILTSFLTKIHSKIPIVIFTKNLTHSH